ncbi:uncharacterized protein LOC133196722 [Saccostrea echinata]|uniref:uncharacterized protein LOC133196722 n=1 Tax=Saccostrea echinata TaxID=191078 RepID=UPI002A836450|nr:uncharacterized protein LOC133196722 [Saccostrea echinata]
MADNNIENFEEDQSCMRNEWRRVLSFATFPGYNSVSTIRLARSGFYYTGTECLCRCIFCGSEQSNWTQEYFPSHCEEISRRESNEPINQELEGHFSSDNGLFTQFSQTPTSDDRNCFFSASTHSFDRLWEGLGVNYCELHVPPENSSHQNNPELFQWLRIQISDCLNLNSTPQPHFRDSTTPTSNSSIFQHLRICEETNSRFLSSENNNVTSNQSTREMIGGDIFINESTDISPLREDNNQISRETSRVLHPSIKQQKANNSEKEKLPIQNSRNKPEQKENKYQNELKNSAPEAKHYSNISTSTQESNLRETESEDYANNTCQLGLHRRSLNSAELSGFDDGQSLDISDSFGPSNLSLPMTQSNTLSDFGILRRPNQDILGQNCAPMSRSVRNTQEIPQTYTERMATFHNWPSHLRQCPMDMVDAGFYYTGRNDCVRCPYCNIGLYKWESSDIPLEEHARHSPDCKFIQQCRQRQQDLALENQPRTRETITLDQIKHLDSLKEVLDLCFNIDDILRAYNTLSHTLDIRELTSTDILCFFFDNDQDEEESFSGDSCVCCMCCDRVVCVMFLPCRHGCCVECEQETEQCPYCYHYIKAVHRVYVG